MNGKTQYERIIFGLKVKQARQGQGLSFAELSKSSGMSISYLNEIEKGKKFPKKDKVEALALALEVSSAELLSAELEASLAPIGALLKSNFLNELPLDLFGIDLAKVVEIIANAPTRVSAFISTMLEISRNFALKESNFYFGALRSYLQLHHNYFPDLEAAVINFARDNHINLNQPISCDDLRQILKDNYRYKIVDQGLDEYPSLQSLRSVYIAQQQQLLLNSKLTETQISFQLGKEIAFQYLNLKERASTASLQKTATFEEVLNHSKAIYFSVALHIQESRFVAAIQQFLQAKTWNGEQFLGIMKLFEATPEMFYHRLTNVLPAHFGIHKLFFLRFTHDIETDRFDVDRELHFTKRHYPHRNGLNEHYCRRWIATGLLSDLQKMQLEGKYVQAIVHAQRSQSYGTNDEYLCLTIARPSYPSPNQNVSVTLGLQINKALEKQIHFLNDPAIPVQQVNVTCERCPIAHCTERAAPPTVVERRLRAQQMADALEQLGAEK